MYGTAGAADAIGVTPARVRALIRGGHLRAHRVSRDWVIPEESLTAFLGRSRPAAHRPFSARMAWAAAREAAGEPSPWASSSERSRLRHRLRDGSSSDVWRARLAGRGADLQRYRIHPLHLVAFHTDGRIHAAASDQVSADLQIAGGSYLVWCASPDLPGLVSDHPLLRSSRPNVVVRQLPPEVDLEAGASVPTLIAGADLCDEGDARSVRTGASLLSDAIAAFRDAG